MEQTQDKESLQYKIPAFGSHVCVALFNPYKWDGVLVPLGQGIPSDEVQADYRSRGLWMVATFGFLDGRFCSAFECPLDDAMISYLAKLYVEFIYSKLVTHAPSKAAADAAVDELRRMYAMPAEDRSREN